MKKLGLALGSGGARGIAHIGFLQALEEAGIRPSCITGCSMGAIIGSLYAAGVSLEKIREHSAKLRLLQIASLNINPIRANGVFQFNKARKLMTEYIGEKTFADLDIPFCCVATDLVEGKIKQFTEGSVVEAALASSAIPGIFTPIEIDKKQYIDGGVLERVPTEELKSMGAEVVVAVDVLGDLTVKNVRFTLIDTVLRCIDIMDTRQTQRKKKARKNSVDLWLEPDLGGMDQYKVKKSHMEFAYDKGYELGTENIERIRSLLE